jgi:glycosyltransferase involved in cell wall biosynthesis
MEAMMTGIPIVALGPKHCNRDYPEQETYEVHEIIKDGLNGFVSDNIEELRARIKMLLENEELARTIGQAGRETAIKLFGKQVAKEGWKSFLEKITEEHAIEQP